MNLAFLSGKGGTGKTTVAVNFAFLNQYPYYDFDVEEPNGHIFLKPDIKNQIQATIKNPIINTEKCILCGDCVKACQFGVLANTKKEVMIFNELCHGCGACSLACKYHAITEYDREIGKINIGHYNGIDFGNGVLNLKEPFAVPVINQLANQMKESSTINVIDSPPGSSCSVVETLEKVDYAVVVTEPTLFGLSDLKMVLSVLKSLNIEYGVIINRSNCDDYLIEDYLNEKSADLIGKIPYLKSLAETYSKGEILVDKPEFKDFFQRLNKEILSRVDYHD